MEFVEMKRVIDWESNAYLIPAEKEAEFEYIAERTCDHPIYLEKLEEKFGQYKIMDDQYSPLFMTPEDLLEFTTNR